MRIGIDARALQGETRYRGIGKALGFFLESLKKFVSEDDELVFYIDDELPKPELIDIFENKKVVKVPTSRLGRARYFRSVLPSYRTANAKKSDVDVFLQYDANLGVPIKVPSVVMFHDLIPYIFRNQEKQQKAKGFRQLKNAAAREAYWRKYLKFLDQYKRAERILAISGSSEKDLRKYFPRLKMPIEVVHLGVSPHRSHGEISDKIKKMAESEYVMYVGGIDLRKNVVGLLKSFYEVKEKHSSLKLITVGKEFGLSDQLGDLGWHEVLGSNKAFAKDVISPGFITDAEIDYLLKHSAAFIFPSRYEGFGLPVLEAMQVGSPVIAYSNSSIPEVAGKAVMLVEDGESLVPAITRLLDDKQLRLKLIAAGKEQAKKFTWDKTAQKTLKVLREVGEK